MNDMPRHERPMSEQFRLVARKFCAANAKARRFEAIKSTELERRKKDLIRERGPMPDAAAEREVKASDDWMQFLEEGVAAMNEAERHKLHMELLEIQRWEINDANASHRAEMKHLNGAP